MACHGIDFACKIDTPLLAAGSFIARALAGNQDVVHILSGADIEILNVSVFGNSLGMNPYSANPVGVKVISIETSSDEKGQACRC